MATGSFALFLLVTSERVIISHVPCGQTLTVQEGQPMLINQVVDG